jgi:hypothetical protein
VYSGRTGLQNTSFALLDPSGKKISRGSRSPSQTYGSAEKFAVALKELSDSYAKKAKPIEALPTVRDLRLALNVAAADMRPLVVVRGKNAAEAKKLQELVASTAWSEEVIGTSHYVVLSEEVDYEGLRPKLGVTVIQPDPYGLGGEVLSHVAPGKDAKKLGASVAKGIAKHSAESREHRDHVREARRKGITWESEIPVSDDRSKRK